MSSRTVRRLAPAMLVAALAAPAPAQDKPVAPPPRAAAPAHDFAALRRHMGVPVPLFAVPAPARERQYIAIQWQHLRDDVFELARGRPACDGCGTTKDAAFVIGAGGLTRVMPMPEPPQFLVPATPIPTGSFVVHGPGRLVLASAAVTAVGCDSCSAPSAKSDGTWYREVGGSVVAVTFAGDHLTLKMTLRDGDLHAALTVTAHCTRTTDGLVYGAITSADIAPAAGGVSGTDLPELALVLQGMQGMVDHPFSFRAKMTSEGLSVSGLKISGFERDKKELLALCGLYKHAKDGKVPEPKAQSAKVGRCEECRPVIGGPTSGTIEYRAPLTTVTVGADGLQRIGVDFAAPVSPPMAIPAAPRCVPPADVKPISVAFPNDAMKQMAADVFGQMMLPPATVPSTGGATFPRLQTGTAGMTLPSPKYLEHYPQYFAPDPAFPLPRELAAQDEWKVVDPCYPERYKHAATQATVVPFAVQVPNGTHTAAPKHVGTWVREVGSKRCVLKVAADHFTLTVSDAHEVEGGKTVTAHLTFTVEYHLTRDGVTAVGLVTGVDVKFEGDLPATDGETIVGRTGELQKVLEDMPLALTLRTYPDALVVGNVRMPTTNRLMESEPTAYLGGRYRLMTEKALSPLKVVKAPKPACVPPPPVALPSGAYGVPIGAYGSGPVGDLLPPQQVLPLPVPGAALLPRVEEAPLTPIVPTYGVTIPDPVPTMTPPAPPARVMPMPKPPGAVVPTSFAVPDLGPFLMWSNDPFPLVRSPGENRQVFDFSVGVFGSR